MISDFRRRHTVEFRLNVLKECRALGSSIVVVARSHQFNANLVHKWRRDHQGNQAPQRDDFVVLPVLAMPVAQLGPDRAIKVDLLTPTGQIVPALALIRSESAGPLAQAVITCSVLIRSG